MILLNFLYPFIKISIRFYKKTSFVQNRKIFFLTFFDHFGVFFQLKAFFLGN
jgi:hypothetical protein